MQKSIKKIFCLFLAITFLSQSITFGQPVNFKIPEPNISFVSLTLNLPDTGRDAINRVSTGLNFNLNIQPKNFSDKIVKTKTKEIVDYFFSALSVDFKDLWVNLNPNDPQRIIGKTISDTDLGKVLLVLDLKLKKDTAFELFPGVGKNAQEYWNRVFSFAKKLQDKSVGATPCGRPNSIGQAQGPVPTKSINIPTQFRVWIVPDQAQVYEDDKSITIVKASLKVLLESEYLKDSVKVSEYQSVKDNPENQLQSYCEQQLKELILPELTRKVNLDKAYEPLRQIYQALILAQWVKEKLKTNSVETQNFASLLSNYQKTHRFKFKPEQMFQAYLKSVQKGEYKLVDVKNQRELNRKIKRTYASGGVLLAEITTAKCPQAEGLAVQSTQPTGHLALSAQALTTSQFVDAIIESLNSGVQATEDMARAILNLFNADRAAFGVAMQRLNRVGNDNLLAVVERLQGDGAEDLAMFLRNFSANPRPAGAFGPNTVGAAQVKENSRKGRKQVKRFNNIGDVRAEIIRLRDVHGLTYLNSDNIKQNHSALHQAASRYDDTDRDSEELRDLSPWERVVVTTFEDVNPGDIRKPIGRLKKFDSLEEVFAEVKRLEDLGEKFTTLNLRLHHGALLNRILAFFPSSSDRVASVKKAREAAREYYALSDRQAIIDQIQILEDNKQDLSLGNLEANNSALLARIVKFFPADSKEESLRQAIAAAENDRAEVLRELEAKRKDRKEERQQKSQQVAQPVARIVSIDSVEYKEGQVIEYKDRANSGRYILARIVSIEEDPQYGHKIKISYRYSVGGVLGTEMNVTLYSNLMQGKGLIRQASATEAADVPVNSHINPSAGIPGKKAKVDFVRKFIKEQFEQGKVNEETRQDYTVTSPRTGRQVVLRNLRIGYLPDMLKETGQGGYIGPGRNTLYLDAKDKENGPNKDRFKRHELEEFAQLEELFQELKASGELIVPADYTATDEHDREREYFRKVWMSQNHAQAYDYLTQAHERSHNVSDLLTQYHAEFDLDTHLAGILGDWENVPGQLNPAAGEYDDTSPFKLRKISAVSGSLNAVKSIILSKNVRADLLSSHHIDNSNETGGLLLGYKHGDRLIIVDVYMDTENISATPYSLTFYPDFLEEAKIILRLLNDDRYRRGLPELIIVGWWHMHPKGLGLYWVGRYSSVDISLQETTFPENMGILVCPLDGNLYFWDGRIALPGDSSRAQLVRIDDDEIDITRADTDLLRTNPGSKIETSRFPVLTMPPPENNVARARRLTRTMQDRLKVLVQQVLKIDVSSLDPELGRYLQNIQEAFKDDCIFEIIISDKVFSRFPQFPIWKGQYSNLYFAGYEPGRFFISLLNEEELQDEILLYLFFDAFLPYPRPIVRGKEAIFQNANSICTQLSNVVLARLGGGATNPAAGATEERLREAEVSEPEIALRTRKVEPTPENLVEACLAQDGTGVGRPQGPALTETVSAETTGGIDLRFIQIQPIIR